jgi:hypothetical protein
MKQATKKISHYTRFRDELRAEATRLAITRNDLIDRYIEEGLAASLPPSKCCLTCRRKHCQAGHCPKGHASKIHAEEVGVCDSCDICLDHKT